MGDSDPDDGKGSLCAPGCGRIHKSSHGKTRNQGIGIVVPGLVDENDTAQGYVNLGWGEFSIRERMKELLPEIPNVKAGNDATIATLGELCFGGGRGNGSAAMFTLGTGVEGGIAIAGKTFRGFHGGAGEWWHIVLAPQEKDVCNCGKRGCLEQCTDYLGRAMSYVACAVDPEVFLIGGGMSRAGAVLLDRIRRSYKRYAFHVLRDTPIKEAELGNDAGIYGCVKMVRLNGQD